MSDLNDKQLENYLATFRPVDPEPLPVRGGTNAAPKNRRAALAVATVACLAAAALALIVLSRGSQSTNDEAPNNVSSSTKPEIASMPALVRLALDDQNAFDKIMNAKVETQFPPMQGEQSALRVLAKE